MPAVNDVDETGQEAVEEPLLDVPYDYTILTDEICQSLTEDNLDAVPALFALGENDNDTDALLAMQELVHAVASGRIDPKVAGALISGFAPVEDDDADSETADPTQITQALQSAVVDAISVLYDDNGSLPFRRISDFLSATQIPVDILRNALDQKLLMSMGLVQSIFDKQAIRKQTNVVYRQANFNLVREESEGFAKLVTEVFSCCTSQEPTGTNAEEAVEKVKALIGAFDLDVGRSLDVVLDVFGSVLVRSFRFFVKFLRASPWWPRGSQDDGWSTRGLPRWALPGVEDWKITEEQRAEIASENLSRDADFWALAKDQGLRAFYQLGLSHIPGAASYDSNDEFSKAWVEETGTQPPSGNHDAAQLLGFKLRFYSESPARDESDTLPDNLMFLSALLIKIGFISLKDLFPHLWRQDEAMEQLKAQKIVEKEERERAARPGAGTKNALLTAGALSDDPEPSAGPRSAVPRRLNEASTRAGTPSREPEADKASTKGTTDEPADQKIALLKALLAIGALPEALFMIGRFPWVLELIPDLPEYFFRILKYCISSVSAQSQPLADRATLQQTLPYYETDIPGLPKGQVKVEENHKAKELRWPYLDKADSPDGKSYKFYFDEWNDLLPVCQTVDDVFVLFDTLLPLVGVKIGHDPELVTKIARIGKCSLKQDSTEANRDRWLDFSKRILLPCISLTKANAGVVNEVFELLIFFPTRTRYLLYLEWRDGRTSRNPDVKIATEQARAETRDLLKRISKTNARQMARSLAKIAYANPHIVTTVALNQIESYDSISTVFVEGSRYFTDLGYDVLTWNLIFSMAKAGRSNTQDGGIFASRWLTALSRFAGDIYKRYSMMKAGPILQYIARELGHGNTMDLKMLENIVTSMAGITNDTTYNESQLQAMGGGSLLQSQTILQLLDARHEKHATSKRLMAALQSTGLTGKFLVLMAQQRQACLTSKSDAPLKVIGNTYDDVHRVLVQYLDLLQHGLGMRIFAEVVPDVVALMVAYEIPPEIAFMICRSVLSRKITEYERKKADDASLAAQEAPNDVDMKDAESSEEDGEAEEDEPTEVNGATPTEDDTLNAATESEPIDGALNEHSWHPILEKVMDDLRDHLPQELSLYDIAIPRKAYSDEIARQKKKRDAVKLERAVGSSATRKKEDAVKALDKLINDLLAENGQHVKAQIACRKRLSAEKQAWFVGQARNSERLSTALWEYCLLPRILASPLDAYFSFALVKSLHSLGTPNFSTLGLYDLFFRTDRLVSLIFSSSSKEAEHFGRFLAELLKDLNRWHKSKTIYEKEAWGLKKQLPGFATKSEGGKPIAFMPYDTFRKLLYKWHTITHQAFQKCLKSTEYMHVRNAISILHAVSEGGTYPVINIHGVSLQTTIDKLRSSEMQDLVVASTSLLSALKRSEKQWIPPSSFNPGIAKESTPVPPPVKKEATPAVEAPQTKKEDQSTTRDVDMIDVSSGAPKSESGRESKGNPQSDSPSKLPPRPGAVDGVATRERDPRSSSRQGRPEAPRSTLPRKLSPPPRHTPPAANLPTRPDQTDSRNAGRDREPPRLPRAPQDGTRPPHARDSRDARDVRDSRDARDPRDIRDPRSSYRGAETHYEDYERLPRRYEQPDVRAPNGRDDRGYPRERDAPRPQERLRDSERDRDKGSDRDRPPTRNHSRERESRDRPPRESAIRQPADDSSNRPPRISSRAEPAPPASQPDIAVNPARAALINTIDNRGPPISTTRPPPSRSDHPQRASSPRREDPRDRFGMNRNRDDRQSSDRLPPDSHQSRHTTPSQAPRSEYPPRSSRDERPPHRNVDMEAGRLEREPAPSAQPRNEPKPDIPSGPRAAGSMPAPRGPGGPPAINTRITQQPSNDRPPTGPSSGRHSRAPSLSDQSGSKTPDTAGVHPSRMGMLTSPVAPPPAGPRGRGTGPPAQAPSGPAPVSRGPPAGPASAEMGRGARPARNQMNAVNDTLAQASTTSRGRGGRTVSSNYPPHGGAPNGPPLPTSAPDRGPRNDNYGQNDLFASHSSANDTPIGARPQSTCQDSMRSNDRRPPSSSARPDERPPQSDDLRRSTRSRNDDPRDHHDARNGGRDRDTRGDHSSSSGRPTDQHHHHHRDAPPSQSSRRGGGDDRPNRRHDGPPGGTSSSYNDDRSGGPGGARGEYRNDGGPPPSGPGGRKHPRSDENGAGQYDGGRGGGRGGRVASESKRPRRGA
ncbi:THO complex subunit 2 [Cyphellophora attinorum]|uniref:THO complex subunit 2 n=1 Tax=Cyphellophora attinorum TaxID=1664694 RepID=A0A0N1H7S7_9EURO|nr:THO complex subunit 2 [Phialophora attinorum]KPI37746.1 THO complex subunit 2 [Phialophora attinorum]